MNKLENFMEQLSTAIAARYFNSKHECSLTKCQTASKDSLVLYFRPKTQGLRQCVNCKQLTIRPNNDQSHHMLIEEIWLGYDAEGYRWSDHMGGVNVDCTGMKFQEAIDHITVKIWEDFADLVQ